MLRFAVATLVIAGVMQDPTKSLPDAYEVQFENNFARVVRVHYDAGAKLPEHTHAAGTTIYVYLNDSDGVVFKHSGNNNRSVTRPAVKAGAIRVSTGPEEHHTAENTSSAPTDFLRIWLKTENAGARNRRRIPPTENEFTNKQVRITRIALEQHDEQTITAKEPTLLIELPSGTEQWIDAGGSRPIANHDPCTVNYVRIDVLTKPM
ncbi:MAG: hypothetical protein K2Y23_12030 [Cyanobacteria bacterium]|nr:hypothetical protein [Cyanobacteriota bacterium]